jgi:hypothetical protein
VRVCVCVRAPSAHSLAPFVASASTVETACHSLCAALYCVDRTGLPARTHAATHSVADVLLHVLVSALKRARLLLGGDAHVLSVQCTDLTLLCVCAPLPLLRCATHFIAHQASFTERDDVNLIIAKQTTLEVRRFSRPPRLHTTPHQHTHPHYTSSHRRHTHRRCAFSLERLFRPSAPCRRPLQQSRHVGVGASTSAPTLEVALVDTRSALHHAHFMCVGMCAD